AASAGTGPALPEAAPASGPAVSGAVVAESVAGPAPGSGAGALQAARAKPRPTASTRACRGLTGERSMACILGGGDAHDTVRGCTPTIKASARPRPPAARRSADRAALFLRQGAPQQGVEAGGQQAEAGLGGVDLVVPEGLVGVRSQVREIRVGKQSG